MFAYVLLGTLLAFCFNFCLSKFLSKSQAKQISIVKVLVNSSGFPHYLFHFEAYTWLAVISHSFL